MVVITHIRTCGGPQVEHITDVCWHETASGRYGASTLEQIAQYVAKGNRVHMWTPGTSGRTTIRHPDQLLPTNLLSLPRF